MKDAAFNFDGLPSKNYNKTKFSTWLSGENWLPITSDICNTFVGNTFIVNFYVPKDKARFDNKFPHNNIIIIK